MKCYLFDENNRFSGEYDAQESPLEPGIYILPEQSTLIAPPPITANEYCLFDDGKWAVKQYPVEPLPAQPTIEELRAQMVLTPAQARVKLANLGLLAGIEATISALPVDNLTRIYWFYATEFRRDDAILTTFCADNLGLSPEQIDALFS